MYKIIIIIFLKNEHNPYLEALGNTILTPVLPPFPEIVIQSKKCFYPAPSLPKYFFSFFKNWG